MLARLLVQSITTLFNIFFWLILIRALLSWFRPSGYNRLYEDLARVLYTLTEPVLAPIRRVLPAGGMGMDFSPLIALFLLEIIQRVLVSIVYTLF